MHALQHWFNIQSFHSENKHFHVMLWYFQIGATDPYPSATFQIIPFFM